MAQCRPTNRFEATFVSVFPHVVNIGNFLLLGSDRPIPYDPQLLLKCLQDSQVVGYLTAGIFDVSKMRPFVESPTVIWTSTTPRADSDIDTDLLPKDEYYLNNDQ